MASEHGVTPDGTDVALRHGDRRSQRDTAVAVAVSPPAAAVVDRRAGASDELVEDLHEPLRVVLVREVAGVGDHLDGRAGRDSAAMLGVLDRG